MRESDTMNMKTDFFQKTETDSTWKSQPGWQSTKSKLGALDLPKVEGLFKALADTRSVAEGALKIVERLSLMTSGPQTAGESSNEAVAPTSATVTPSAG